MARSGRVRLLPESVGAYMKRVGVSYRQARKAVLGAVYEHDLGVYGGHLGKDRSARRRIRNAYWVERWKARHPEDSDLSTGKVVRKWHALRIVPPRAHSHGTHRAGAKERARMTDFLFAMGMDPMQVEEYFKDESRHYSKDFFDSNEDTGL